MHVHNVHIKTKNIYNTFQRFSCFPPPYFWSWHSISTTFKICLVSFDNADRTCALVIYNSRRYNNNKISLLKQHIIFIHVVNEYACICTLKTIGSELTWHMYTPASFCCTSFKVRVQVFLSLCLTNILLLLKIT